MTIDDQQSAIDDTSQTTPLRALLATWRDVETPAAWFLLMSFLDGAMTFILLTRGNQRGLSAFEANRLAAYFLDRWGLKGLFLFKLALVLFVCATATVIAVKSADAARAVLNFGTFAATLVVIYSAWLYVQ